MLICHTCCNRTMFHLVAYEGRDDGLIDYGQSDDEDGNEYKVLVAVLQRSAALEEGGHGGRGGEGEGIGESGHCDCGRLVGVGGGGGF
jgi:hypothetical protein